ncbi:unnamed protein product [Schistocephalus solidus]|uniref:Uncharacterized protein n=1 Tax=Schistocephalus solidus TaxID=70667 RepID=A0A183ST09_SCHSO|nr:unnamed protein product [Schistocephalus solidus]
MNHLAIIVIISTTTQKRTFVHKAGWELPSLVSTATPNPHKRTKCKYILADKPNPTMTKLCTLFCRSLDLCLSARLPASPEGSRAGELGLQHLYLTRLWSSDILLSSSPPPPPPLPSHAPPEVDFFWVSAVCGVLIATVLGTCNRPAALSPVTPCKELRRLLVVT